MSEPAEVFEHNGKTIEIHWDEDPSSPRDADNLGIMLADGHRRYTLGDEEFNVAGYDEAQSMLHHLAEVGHMREFPNWCKKRLGSTVVLALGLIDHSGISMYTIGSNLIEDPEQRRDTAHPHDPGGWDSGMVGFIFDSAKTREMCGTPLDRIEEVLRAEVKEYDMYLTGQVYGYIIDPDGEAESCWGFIGEQYAIQEARWAAGYTCKHCQKALHGNHGNILDEHPDPEARKWTHTCCETCGRDVAWGGDGWYHVNMAPWDWPGGKPDHVAKSAERYHCEDGLHLGETDQKVEVA